MVKFLKEIKDYIIIIVVVILIRTFLVTPAIVDGDSMNETLLDGNLVLINKLTYRKNEIQRFDIVVFDNDTDNDNTNDFIAETKDNEYFVLGDNREVSKDSRILGNFTKDKIIGKVNIRFYPLDRIGKVK